MPHPTIVLDEPVQAGDTVKFVAHVRDFAGNLTDPSSGGFIVYNSAEQVVVTLPQTRVSTGEYDTHWQVPLAQPRGWYYVEYFGTIGGFTHRRRARFQIVFG